MLESANVPELAEADVTHVTAGDGRDRRDACAVPAAPDALEALESPFFPAEPKAPDRGQFRRGSERASISLKPINPIPYKP